MIKNFIFLGAPGVGKGTLANKVANTKGMIHISTGAIFRNEIAEGTELGKRIKHIVDAGGYVPDPITNILVEKTLESTEVREKGFILDGYPRTINQAEFLKKIHAPITAAVLLEASDEMIASRLSFRAEKENRGDDTPEVIANRIKVYKEKTAPLISWYQKENLLKAVDAQGDLEENYQNFLKVIYD